MGIVSGGGGAAFNGGTITTKLVIAPAAVGSDFIPLDLAPAAADAGNFGSGILRITSPSVFGSGFGDRFISTRGFAGTEMYSVRDDGTWFFRSGSGDASASFYGQTITNNWNFDTGGGCTFKIANVTKFSVGSTGGVSCGALTATGNVALGDNAADTVAFYGHAGAAQQTVTGAKLPSDVVLASLLTALAAMGLIVDSST